jgi:hypothetical protein
MNLGSIGATAFSPVNYLTQYASSSSTSVDSVQLSPQAKLLAAQNQAGQSLWAQLAQALQSGNLAGAQAAFGSLQQSLGGQGGLATPASQTAAAAASASQTAPADPMGQDFAALGQALKSGDVQAAQDALTKLQQDFQALRAKHHHHHKPSSSSGGSSNNNTYVDISLLSVNVTASQGASGAGTGQTGGKT